MHRVSAKEARRSKRGSSAVLEFSYGGLLDDEPDTPKGRTSRDRYYYEPVFAVSASQIGKLSGMHAQEDMQEFVHEWSEDLGPLIFITHQWTSYTAPDPTGSQLALLQQALENALSGNLNPDRASNPASSLYLKQLVEALLDPRGAWIWCDIWSIPQRYPVAKTRAIYSIAAYLYFATAMICICPPTAHAETGQMCDFNSWARRGWCRLERLGFHLNRYRTGVYTPLYVFNSTDSLVPFAHGGMGMGSQFLSPEDSIFNGDFGCCALNHMIGGVPVVCDKIKL